MPGDNAPKPILSQSEPVLGTTASAEVLDGQKAVALGLEFSKRAQEATSLDELLFILTNDLRILIEFDRALVIAHVGPVSKLVAASNQPVLETKFPLQKAAASLVGSLRNADRGLLISAQTDAATLSEQDVPPAAREQLLAYMKRSGCAFLVCVPLKHNKTLLGHLLLEFYGDNVPRQTPVVTLLSIAPLLATAVAEKWLLQAKPSLWNQVFATETSEEHAKKRALRIVLAALAGFVVLCGLFLVPVTYTVGGEAEVFLHDKHMAFAKIDGLVDRIDVKEGSRVEKDQVVAILDRRELDHETKSAQRRLEILTREMMLLRREAGQDPAKLAESDVVQLKSTSAKEELEYLRWKAQFLDIRTPVAGVVVTKDVDSLVGKRFKAGEPFCEIAAPDELWVSIYVPEEKISVVKKGQPAEIYLNSEPGKGYASKVEDIAPIAQVLPRLGSVYRVGMPFPLSKGDIRVGMKGVGKIDAARMSLFDILKNRFLARWNQYAVYF